MLTRAEVAEVARGEGLGDVADELAATAQPGWRLVRAEGGASLPGATKLGGDPDLAPGETWPVNARGVPLTFLAQIDTRALPPVDAEWADRVHWAHGGRLLRLFADLLDTPGEPDVAAALVADARQPLQRVPHPAVPPQLQDGPYGDWGIEDRIWDLAEHALRPVAFLTVPEFHPGVHEDVTDDSERAERHRRFTHRVRNDGRPVTDGTWPLPWEFHHLLGAPCSIQDDTRYAGPMVYGDADPSLAAERTWGVLLALHTDPQLDLEILDGGAIHVLAPLADLAAGRYDRLVYDISTC